MKKIISVYFRQLRTLACVVVAITLVIAGLIPEIHAETVTFNALPAGGVVPNGYAGFNWSDIWVLDATSPNSGGYHGANIFGPNLAWSHGEDGEPYGLSLITSSAPFDFKTATLNAGWSNPINITVIGKCKGVQKYTKTVIAYMNVPTTFTFDYKGETRLSSIPFWEVRILVRGVFILE